MRIFLKIMYDGSGYHGWQIQPGLSTVQGEITAAIKKLTGEDINLTGSGRTDTGVHALGQAAHFDSECILSDFASNADTGLLKDCPHLSSTPLMQGLTIKKLVSGLNFYLPLSIRIIQAKQVSDSFNARFNAVLKTYSYLFYQSNVDNPFLKNRALRVNDINIKSMQKAATLFKGEYDFKPFMSSGSEVKTTVRTITQSRIYKKDDLFVYEVTANGFLYNMVRKIFAFLLLIGKNKRKPSDVLKILKCGTAIKELAPPCGLYLKSVFYGDDSD